MSTSTSTSSTTIDKAIETVTAHVNTLAVAADPYIPQTAKDAAVQIKDTVITHATTVKDTFVANATALQAQAKDLQAQATENAAKYSQWAYTSATTTITAYTPGPVLSFVNDTVAKVEEVKKDPAGTLKPYIPAYIIHTSERTLEIVTEGFEHTVETVNEKVNGATGFVVSKVNGTVEYIKSLPEVNTVIEKLNSFTAPVIEKIRAGSHLSASEAEAEVVTIAAAAK
ncbi:hypothetical protein HDU83_004562 [Entophlyctis luteolus]|nr:hypothetical protein HDU83_004562 [Entophlyctis luteolus]